LESRNDVEEADESSDSCRDVFSEKPTQFTPQGFVETDIDDGAKRGVGAGTFAEPSERDDTQDNDSSVFSSLFDLFETRKRKPRHRKSDETLKYKEKEKINSADEFTSFGDNLNSSAEVKRNKKMECFNEKLNSKVRKGVTAKVQTHEKFSFLPKMTEDKKVKKEMGAKSNNGHEIEDYESLIREFDAAIESSESPVKNAYRECEKGPKPSTSGFSKSRGRKKRPVVDSSNTQTGPSPAKSGKFTRLKVSPNENTDCDSKGKGVGKKSNHIGGKREADVKLCGDPRVSLKRENSASDMDASFSSISEVFSEYLASVCCSV
jgi:hypothetical protein